MPESVLVQDKMIHIVVSLFVVLTFLTILCTFSNRRRDRYRRLDNPIDVSLRAEISGSDPTSLELVDTAVPSDTPLSEEAPDDEAEVSAAQLPGPAPHPLQTIAIVDTIIPSDTPGNTLSEKGPDAEADSDVSVTQLSSLAPQPLQAIAIEKDSTQQFCTSPLASIKAEQCHKGTLSINCSTMN